MRLEWDEPSTNDKTYQLYTLPKLSSLSSLEPLVEPKGRTLQTDSEFPINGELCE